MKTTKKRVCNKGFSCGASCIAKGKTCWANFPPEIAKKLKKFRDKAKKGKASELELATLERYLNPDKSKDSKPKNLFNRMSEQIKNDIKSVPEPRVQKFLEQNNIDLFAAPGKLEVAQWNEDQLRRNFLDGLPKPSEDVIIKETGNIRSRSKKKSLIDGVVELYAIKEEVAVKLSVEEMVKMSQFANLKNSAGITTKAWNHVIVASLSQFGKTNTEPDNEVIKKVLETSSGFSTNGDFTKNPETKDRGPREIRLMTAIHEIGHQVQFKAEAKNPTIEKFSPIHNAVKTEYSKTNNQENFAENFVLFTFHPEKFKKDNPKGYQIMNDHINSVVK